MCGLTDGSARAEGDVGEEGRVGFRGFVGAAVPESRGVGHSACLCSSKPRPYRYFRTAPRSAVAPAE